MLGWQIGIDDTGRVVRHRLRLPDSPHVLDIFAVHDTESEAVAAVKEEWASGNLPRPHFVKDNPFARNKKEVSNA